MTVWTQVQRLKPEIHRLARRFRQEAYADDILQDVYVSLVTKYPEAHSRKSRHALIRKVAWNRLIDKARFRANRKIPLSHGEIPLSPAFACDYAQLLVARSPDGTWRQTVLQCHSDPADLMQRKVNCKRLRTAVSHLPHAQRRAFEQIVLLDRPQAVVARESSTCLKTLRNRLHEARQRLRRDLLSETRLRCTNPPKAGTREE